MGLGLFLIWLNYEKWMNTNYIISAEAISVSEKSAKKTMQKSNITEIEVVQSKFQKLLGICDVRIKSKKGMIAFQGIEMNSDIFSTLTSLI